MTLGLPSLMVDWLTVELPDPVGIPINSGHVIRVSQHGDVEWTTPARLNVEGSWSSNMTFRAVGAECADDDRHRAAWELDPCSRQSGLEISGNPAKFLTGHNLFGSDDVTELLAATVGKAKDAIWPELFQEPVIDFSDGLLSRIDLTASWLLEREADVLPVLQAMEESVWCPYRGRGVFDAGGSSLYYGRTAKGKRAKDWALKLYWKGPEVTAHPLPRPAYEVPGMLNELNRTIRVELTLRTPELKRLGLRKVGQWTPAKVREIWEAYVSKLNFGKTVVNLDTTDLAQLGLKPRHVLAMGSWMAGNDLRAAMPKRSFYRLRAEILHETGFDIAARYTTKSNVVPLRRVVEVGPAPHPAWAKQLTSALASAA
ncbi:MAG: phage/plasmid replication protein, II/X family [Pseudomonadota bacterium]|nr:phage/plasmid replication protein, II/X family [Pseudomonadota bacterium]